MNQSSRRETWQASKHCHCKHSGVVALLLLLIRQPAAEMTFFVFVIAVRAHWDHGNIHGNMATSIWQHPRPVPHPTQGQQSTEQARQLTLRNVAAKRCGCDLARRRKMPGVEALAWQNPVRRGALMMSCLVLDAAAECTIPARGRSGTCGASCRSVNTMGSSVLPPTFPWALARWHNRPSNSMCPGFRH